MTGFRLVFDSVVFGFVHLLTGTLWTWFFRYLFRDVPPRRSIKLAFAGVLTAACGLFALIISSIFNLMDAEYVSADCV